MSVTLTDEQWDQVCARIEALDNLQTTLVNLTTLPDSTHVDALRAVLPEVTDDLRGIVSAVEAQTIRF